MRVPFRQGIVYAPANFVTLSGNAVSITLASGESVAVHFADGNTNYLITETRTVYDAWYGPFARGVDYWLYWDINVLTGEKSYGYTTIEPTEGPTPPANPQHGHHWFDTAKGSMFEWQGTAGRWVRKLRVFATALYDGNIFISTSIYSPSYIGTQVGDLTANTAGALVYDNSGVAIKKGDGSFFTTEDIVSTGIGSSTRVKIENAVIQAQAVAPIPRYSVVRFVDFNQVVPATNMLKDPGVYGLVETNADIGDIVTVVTEGIFSTPDWDIPNFNGKVNDLVYVSSTGELTLTPQPSHIVGIVIDKNTILLNNMIVDSIGLIESAVTITGPTAGVIITGTTGSKSSAFNITLENDLRGVEDIQTTGIARRVSDGVWSAGLVELDVDVNGVLSVSNGGTGAVGLTGYVKGNGIAPMTASKKVPGGDVDGDILGNAENVTGVVEIDHGGTGATTRDGALNALLPAQTTGTMLVSDGVNASWAPINTGSVTSVAVASATNNLIVSGGPITTAGTITLELQGTLKALDELNTTGWLARAPSGDIITHSVTSPSGSINISNDAGSNYGDIQLDLPVINIAGTYVDVDTDVFGRVISGRTRLDWSKIDPATKPNSIFGYGIVDAYTKLETNALSWNWSAITNTPTTLAGYGITDAFTKAETQALFWDWSRITATPTTLAGYGITDSVKNGGGVASLTIGSTINKPAAGTAGRLFVDTAMNTLSYDNGATWTDLGSQGTVNYVDIVSTSSDLVVLGDAVSTSGTFQLSITGELGAASNLTSVGLVVRNGVNNWSTASVLGNSGEIIVTNGDGAGNVGIGLSDVGSAGTYYKVTTDSKGRVISGSSTMDVSWSDIQVKPTTLDGFGITDAVPASMLGANNGVATLDSLGKIPASQLPALAISDTFVVASQSGMLALNAQPGDIAIRTDIQKTFILAENEPTFVTSWKEILSGGSDASMVTYVNAVSQSTNLTVTGGPVVDTGEFVFGLAGNLAAVAALNTSGIVRLNGGTWSTTLINLDTDTSGFLSVGKGGTGTTTLTGYVKGNGTAAMTASTTIPGSDISGDIAGKAANVTGIVDIAHGGTGASTRVGALDALLPPQLSESVLMTNGTTAVWSSAVPGSLISGAVSLAQNALSLGGYPANQFVPADGTNATGTWDISISGDAASLGGYPASSYVTSNGTGATGTWNINISGDAASLGGYLAGDFMLSDGSNATGTWSINTSGTAANVSGVVDINHGGTGATTINGAIANLLAPQAATAGNVLSTNGTTVQWVDVNAITTGAYSIVMSSTGYMYPARNKLQFDQKAFVITDNNVDGLTDIKLETSLQEIVAGTWGGDPSIYGVGTLTIGTWNASTIELAYGGTGATTQAGAANNILPAQTGNSGKVLSTDGSNVSWTTPTVAFNNVTGKPTTLMGYGITDAVSKAGSTMTGVLTLSGDPTDLLHAATKQYVDTAISGVGGSVGSHTNDYTKHLTSAQNAWLDAITTSSTEVNYLVGVTSNVQTQLDTKEATVNKGVANGYAGLDANGKVPYAQMKGPISSSQTVATGAYYEYDTWADFGNNYDAKSLMISVKVLDSDNTSVTYNMYINSEAVATVAVKDSRYVRVYNDYTTSLTFHISVRP